MYKLVFGSIAAVALMALANPAQAGDRYWYGNYSNFPKQNPYFAPGFVRYPPPGIYPPRFPVYPVPGYGRPFPGRSFYPDPFHCDDRFYYGGGFNGHRGGIYFGIGR